MRLILTVSSSKLVGLAYNVLDAKAYAQFYDGSVYEYDGVEPYTFLSVLMAESQGKAFSAIIEKGNYPYAKVAEPESLGLTI